MGFKEESGRFTNSIKFTDPALNFASSELSRFQKGDGEDASAKVDLALSGASSLSAKKHRAKALEIKRKQKAKERVEKEYERFKEDGARSAQDKTEEDSKSRSSEDKKGEAKTESEESGGRSRDSTSKSDSKASSKKAASKETRKAAAATALSKVMRVKGMIGNDLGSNSSTGDAFKDGNRGAVRVLTEVINPMTYLKGLLAKAAGALAPQIFTVMMYLILAMILVSIIVGMFTSIASVTTKVTGFFSRFFGLDKVYVEEVMTEEEIEDIVSSADASYRGEQVIRYALSKVGSPFSAAERDSGYAFDSSSLAYYSYQAAGVDISYGAGYPLSAAAMASKMYSKGEVVNSTSLDVKDLEPGDLIFYGGAENQRFLGIYHVAIYIGNGAVVEALNEEHGVVYETMRVDNIILVLRP